MEVEGAGGELEVEVGGFGAEVEDGEGSVFVEK